jgi:hypothetical protein
LSRTGVVIRLLVCATCAVLASQEAWAGGEPPPRTVMPRDSRPAREQDGVLEIGDFSSAGGKLPQGWEPLEFKNIESHTRYTVVRDERAWVVRAESRAAASGLIRKGLSIDLRMYPVLRWSWRIDHLIEKSNPARKEGDDYAARIYIAFRYEPDRVSTLRKAKFKAAQLLFGDLPIGAISYIWATETPVSSIVDNPFAGDFVKMIPVQSGPSAVGRWVEQERNVYEDYKRAFGAEPPLVEGVAMMTDTDNTGESATAWYGDIWFVRAQRK